MPTAQEYDAWYYTSRGAWIGEIEFRLLRDLLRAERGASLLDIGCGTGYFTRRFAGEAGLQLIGLDPNASWLDFARTHGAGGERYCLGRAECLPFADHSLDYSVCVTALCFVENTRRAIQQMLRVTRSRFAIGLLNRHSLLYLKKGRAGGSGAYRGAHWHTTREVRLLLEGLPVANLKVRSAVFLAGGGSFAHGVECLIPNRLLLGSFVAIAGDIGQRQPGTRQ